MASLQFYHSFWVANYVRYVNYCMLKRLTPADCSLEMEEEMLQWAMYNVFV
jgi:hypothetical protein